MTHFLKKTTVKNRTALNNHAETPATPRHALDNNNLGAGPKPRQV
jgi:hypothetical protein